LNSGSIFVDYFFSSHLFLVKILGVEKRI